MIEALCKPGRDPREDLPPPIFRKDVVKFEDLQQGMELRGTVLNVVDFGAFVDVGLSDSGLVHISQLSAGYVRSPHDVVAVGDQVGSGTAIFTTSSEEVEVTFDLPTFELLGGHVLKGSENGSRRGQRSLLGRHRRECGEIGRALRRASKFCQSKVE